jgi:hypothetical protein
MPSVGSRVVPLLAQGREIVDTVFSRLVELATYSDGQVPCPALEAYAVIRARQTQAEEAVVAEAKANSVVPPQTVPRSFALFFACAPGQVVSVMDKKAIANAMGYLKDVVTRRAAQAKALEQRYQTDEGFRKLADTLMAKLAAPQNLSIVQPFLAVGGDLWEVEQAAKLMTIPINSVTEIALINSNNEAIRTRQALDQVVAGRRPAAKKSLKWLWWTLGIVGGAAAVGTTIYFVTRRGHRLADGVIDAEFEDVPPPKLKRRRKRRKPQKLLAAGSAPLALPPGQVEGAA